MKRVFFLKVEYDVGYAMLRKCLFEVFQDASDFPNLLPVDVMNVLEAEFPTAS